MASPSPPPAAGVGHGHRSAPLCAEDGMMLDASGPTVVRAPGVWRSGREARQPAGSQHLSYLAPSRICKSTIAFGEGRPESFEAYPGQLDLFRAMAGDEMPWADFAEVGRLCAADLRRIGAARVEVAA